MNKETIVRIMAIIVAVAAALVCMFDWVVVPMWLRIVVAVALVVAAAVCTYFNNDFCEDDRVGTGVTRQRKREKLAGYIGERFFVVDEEVEDESEDI